MLNDHPAMSSPSAPKYTISDAFRMYCIRTNGHGWFRIVRARSFCGMLSWFMLTIICFGVGVALTIAKWTEYTKYRTDSPVSVRIGGLKYPAITVCSSNPIKNSKLSNDSDVTLNIYREYVRQAQQNLVYKTFKDPVFYNEKLKGEYLDVHVEAYKNLIAARDYSQVSEESLRTLGYTQQELILQCTVNSANCGTFKWFYNMVYGNCYTLEPTQTDVMPGIGNAISLTLNSDSSDFLPWYSETDGPRVIIHEKDTLPLNEEAYLATANKYNEFALQQTDSKRLGEPYTDPSCDSDFENFKALFGFTYSFKGCQKTCLQRKIIRDCNCSDIRETKSSVELCNTAAELDCTNLAKIKLAQDPETHCRCPLPCEETTYTVQTSHTSWNTPNQNKTWIKIFMKSLGVRLHEETPSQTTWQFFGWMGGQLYAWCGASLVTGIEFCLFLVSAILVLFTENIDWALAGCNNIK